MGASNSSASSPFPDFKKSCLFVTAAAETRNRTQGLTQGWSFEFNHPCPPPPLRNQTKKFKKWEKYLQNFWTDDLIENFERQEKYLRNPKSYFHSIPLYQRRLQILVLSVGIFLYVYHKLHLKTKEISAVFFNRHLSHINFYIRVYSTDVSFSYSEGIHSSITNSGVVKKILSFKIYSGTCLKWPPSGRPKMVTI